MSKNFRFDKEIRFDFDSIRQPCGVFIPRLSLLYWLSFIYFFFAASSSLVRCCSTGYRSSILFSPERSRTVYPMDDDAMVAFLLSSEPLGDPKLKTHVRSCLSTPSERRKAQKRMRRDASPSSSTNASMDISRDSSGSDLPRRGSGIFKLH
jgi:hypothetical protein